MFHIEPQKICMLSRRKILKQTALLAALYPMRSLAFANNKNFKIDACDWSLRCGLRM